MIYQKQNSIDKNTIHRFELKSNSYQRAYDEAFSVYGILIIPALLGSILMYNVFQLSGNYFTISFLVLIAALINIYFFYRKSMDKHNVLKIIVHENYIQLLDDTQIYFEENIKNMNAEIILCGKKLTLAIKLSSEDFEGVIIGFKMKNINTSIATVNQLCEPDYYLTKSTQVDVFLKNLVNSFDYPLIIN